MTHKSAIPPLVFLLAAASLRAEDPTTMGTVVVTGRRTEGLLEEAPQRIEVISTEEIENTPSRELTDLLKKQSSVDVIQYPGNLSGIGIRGYRPEYSGINQHTLLLIDSRPAMSTNLSLVNMDQVERVEVLKGPASALYGTSAMGGVVNLITRQSRGTIHGFGQVAYGDYQTKEIRGRVGGNATSRLDFDYAGSWFDQSDDFTMGNGVVRPYTDYSQQNHALRVGVDLSSTWRLESKGNLYQGRDIASPGDIFKGINSQSKKDMDSDGVELKLSGKQGAHLLTLTGFQGKQWYELTKVTSTTASDQGYMPYRSYEEDLHWHGIQVQDTWEWSQNATLVAGVDWQVAKSETRSYSKTGASLAPSVADNDRTTLGVYAQNTWTFNNGRSNVYFGLRNDQIQVRTLATPLKTGFSPSQANFNSTSPSLGFKHGLGGAIDVHGTIGRGFITPNAASLTGQYVTVATVKGVTTYTTLEGNPNLKPESSITWDVGVGWIKSKVNVDLTYFRTRVKDKNVSVTTKVDATNAYTTYYNADSSEMAGVELTFGYQITKGVQFDLGGTHYLHAYTKTSGVVEPVKNVGRNALRSSLNLEQGKWEGRLGLRYQGRTFDQDWNALGYPTVEYGGFTVIDVSAGYAFRPQHMVRLSVENLADRYYAEKNGYPLPGRNWKASYRYSF